MGSGAAGGAWVRLRLMLAFLERGGGRCWRTKAGKGEPDVEEKTAVATGALVGPASTADASQSCIVYILNIPFLSRMNEMSLSPVGMEQLAASSVSNALAVAGNHIALTSSPTHNAIPAPGLPVAIPNLGPSLPSALSLMLPMGIGDRGVMCGIPERNYTLPPPPYPHLESSYFRHILPGLISYLADRPPPQCIHPNNISVDSNSALSVSNNPSDLDPYQPNGSVGLEAGIVSMDSRSVNAHNTQSLHPSDGHDVALDTTITIESVSRVTSPISSDRMAEELRMSDVGGDHSQIANGSRNHEPLAVDGSLTSETVGHNGVIPIHGNSLELPVVMETDHISGRVNGMPDRTLGDSIHTVAMSSNSVSVALSTSHNLTSLESVSLHEVGLSLEPVTVSSINQEVGMGQNHVDVSSDSLAFVPSSLQMEDSNSNKENMATLFTIYCPDHGPVTFVSDTPIESRARLSLPKQLNIRHAVMGPEDGVWARETIPVRTCFGPLIGQQSHSVEVADWTDKAANHIWKCLGKECYLKHCSPKLDSPLWSLLLVSSFHQLIIKYQGSDDAFWKLGQKRMYPVTKEIIPWHRSSSKRLYVLL
ncbi:hypothetical protein Chor_009958 [Crotalus horridus]